jgi:hypothetical protein
MKGFRDSAKPTLHVFAVRLNIIKLRVKTGLLCTSSVWMKGRTEGMMNLCENELVNASTEDWLVGWMNGSQVT